MLTVLAGLGYRNVGWDVDPFDWRPDRTAAEVVTAVVAGCLAWTGAPGDAEAGAQTGAQTVARVLLHSWPDVTLAALPLLIAALRAEDAEFVTVDLL